MLDANYVDETSGVHLTDPAVALKELLLPPPLVFAVVTAKTVAVVGSFSLFPSALFFPRGNVETRPSHSQATAHAHFPDIAGPTTFQSHCLFSPFSSSFAPSSSFSFCFVFPRL
eukprot:GHVT01093762.1.p3 GENE.GHVT01093762.1~~GHVT01093762.1.p3  ORF type:complete len:114 (-),score=28.09 GHVT01093762.1:1782-2123(-)